MFSIFALGILVLPIIDDACCPCGLLSKRCGHKRSPARKFIGCEPSGEDDNGGWSTDIASASRRAVFRGQKEPMLATMHQSFYQALLQTIVRLSVHGILSLFPVTSKSKSTGSALGTIQARLACSPISKQQFSGGKDVVPESDSEGMGCRSTKKSGTKDLRKGADAADRRLLCVSWQSKSTRVTKSQEWQDGDICDLSLSGSHRAASTK